MITCPPFKPDTRPVFGSILAMEESLEDHTPPVVADNNISDEPTQTAEDGFTVKVFEPVVVKVW
jgi:hypothetical protein